MSPPAHHTLRLGSCCQFARAPIKFRTTTVTALMRFPRADRLSRLADLCRLNADALLASLNYCAQHGIGAFRINSQILLVKTHPQVGYDLHELPHGEGIIARFRECGAFAHRHAVRLSLHPDQFVVLNSPNAKTLSHSLAELNYQAEVAEWVAADTINIHAGGAYGDKTAALRTLRENIERLAAPVRSRLTLENDDRVYTPADLMPVCGDVSISFFESFWGWRVAEKCHERELLCHVGSSSRQFRSVS